MSKYWELEMIAEPVIPAWTTTSRATYNGSELQRAIIKGFDDGNKDLYGDETLTFEKIFTAKEHGEFFRGALTMAHLRYPNDFYELLQRYGTIKVTINKYQKEEKA